MSDSEYSLWELVEERADTFEGAIVNSIFDLIIQRTTATESICNVHVDPIVHFTNEALGSVKITATDISNLLIEKYGFKEVSVQRVGRILKTLGITSTKSGKANERKRYLNLEQRTLEKLIKKYIPRSVLKTDIRDNMDITTGYREEKYEKNTNVCDICGRDTFTYGYQGMQVCSDCQHKLFTEEEDQ